MNRQPLLISLVAAFASLAPACAKGPAAVDVPAEASSMELLMSPSYADTSPVAADNSAATVAANSFLFPRESSPLGSTWEEWTAAWWQWSLAVPTAENPLLDGPCEVDQSGPVFFLAGNTGGVSTRSCAIPAGKAIFFPLLNIINLYCPEYAGGSYTCEAAMSDEVLYDTTDWFTQGNRTLTLEIDGVPVDGLLEYSAQSGTFQDASPPEWDDRIWPWCTGPIRENPCGVPVGSPRNAVTNGYWVMLRPLPPGNHKIHFTGDIHSNFWVDVSYDITITP